MGRSPGPELLQGPADEMGQGEADGDLAVMFFGGGLDDVESLFGQVTVNFG